MDTYRLIVFDVPIRVELHDLMTTRGARPDSADPLAWLTPSSEVFTAIEGELKDRNVPFETFYELRPSPDEDSRQLAAGIGLRELTDLEASSDDLVLACDERTLATVASKKMVTLLGTMTSGAVFDPLVGHDGFFVLTAAAELPEPVVVPNAMFLSEGDDGVWAVQSDGRELLTTTNLEAVQKHGLVCAPRCVTAGQVLRWRRPLIFSGPVLVQLQAHDIQGLLSAPVFLGHTSEED
jgi:hypothetical protein